MNGQKAAILAEMAFLWGSTNLIYWQHHRDSELADILTGPALRSGFAVAVLLALLLLAADLGGGDYAALFGLLIVLSALLVIGSQTATAFDHLLAFVLEG